MADPLVVDPVVADPVVDIVDDPVADPVVADNPAAKPKVGTITMTNDQLNNKLKSHRMGLQNKLVEAERRAAGFDTMQGQVQDLLESGLIDNIEGEGLDAFRVGVEKTIADHRSESENLKIEAGRQVKELEKATKRANVATEKFTTSTINQAITDEAGSKAFSPSTLKLIRMELRTKAEIQPDDSVLFLMDVPDEDGKVTPTKVSAKTAVELMESNVTEFGSLFASTVSGGAGAEVTLDGVKRTAAGGVDIKSMSMEQYMEIEDKNPGTVIRSLEPVRH